MILAFFYLLPFYKIVILKVKIKIAIVVNYNLVLCLSNFYRFFIIVSINSSGRLQFLNYSANNIIIVYYTILQFKFSFS